MANVSSRRTLTSIAALFWLVGLSVGAMGLIDVISSEQTGARVFGIILVAVSATLLWAGRAATLLWAGPAAPMPTVRPLSLSLMLTACLLIVLVDLCFLLMAMPSLRVAFALLPVVVAILAIATMVLSLFVAVFTIRVARNTIGLRAALRTGSLLPVGVLLSVLSGILTTWYVQSYVPSQRQSNLRVETELSDVRTMGDQTAVSAKISLRNTGQTRVSIIAGAYWIVGVDVDQVAHDARESYEALEKSLLHGHGFRTTYASTRTETLIQFGEIAEGIRIYEPGQESTMTVVAYFPKDQFDFIRLISGVNEANRDRLLLAGSKAIGPMDETFADGSHAVSTVIPVHEISLVRRLTRGDRELVKRWMIAGRSSTDWPIGTPLDMPYVQVFLEPMGFSGDRPFDQSKQRRLHRMYQLFRTGASFELSLWQPNDRDATTPPTQ